MKTQTQVELELIGLHIAAYREKDVNQVYADRLTKAEMLVCDGKVARQKDGHYLVQGSRPEPYIVACQACTCTDFTLMHAPHGWCKHRLAAKMHASVLVDMDTLRSQGVPHGHYTCEHKSTQELCWQVDCLTPRNLLCQACALALSRAPEAQWQETEDGDLGESQATWDEAIGGIPPLNGEGAYPLSTLSPEQLAVIAAPVYEPCPPPAKKKVARQMSSHGVVMPEAPASLNLKLKVGQVELMYTARSMKRGAQGDQELEERLPGILAMLEQLGPEVVEQGLVPTGSFFRRLVALCKLPGSSQERY
mgnify:CR=1 FL=1